jgi:hypothetical protein
MITAIVFEKVVKMLVMSATETEVLVKVLDSMEVLAIVVFVLLDVSSFSYTGLPQSVATI